jgi:hypothetical protein
MSPNAGGGWVEGFCRVWANESSSAYGAQINLGYLFKGTQTWDIFEFFLTLIKSLFALGKFLKIFLLSFLRFSPEFRSSNIYAVTEHTQNQIFFERYPKQFFLQNLHYGPLRWVPRRFSKFWFFIVEICILIRDFWFIFENYFMRMLSIRGNDFIACWAY